ncbi:glycosyltransferase family 2 protein [Clostridium gasigenes]|uniref:glycosyltransferase family 2 protein n=1 Tax=Clostridium gasigenes TaxID=94869 RepID=UPI001C0E7B88|nr:glycosyltransferase family 2 protein [Clostridium gasigenes]MBU3088270.1 glycosyltransferase family 2 protein [Clostridium gasigenes]
MQAKNMVSIIIVNYNKYELTERCIESVVDNLIDIEYEIIVLDNCSTNDSYNELKSNYIENENIKVINSEVNTGFGDGNNKAVDSAKYENVLLLNPDVIVLENSIQDMIKRLYEDKAIGIIGCKLLNDDMTLQYSCRRYLPINEFLLARTPLKKFLKADYIKGINEKYLMKDYDHIEDREVDWIMGSCLLLRKEDFINVGGFSKEYFMYFEDVDLSYKIHKSGKKVLYFPKVEMIHSHEQQSVKKINKLTFIHLSSMIKFYKKYRK